MGTAILDTALGDYDSASVVSRSNSSEGEATETLPTGAKGVFSLSRVPLVLAKLREKNQKVKSKVFV